MQILAYGVLTRPRPRREDVRLDTAGSLALEVQDRPSFPFNWHQHPECELTLIEAGRGVRQVGDHVGPFGPGDLVLLGPGLPHTWTSDAGCGRCRAIVVKFPLGAVAGPGGDGLGLRRLLARAACGLRFPAAPAAVTELRAMAGTTAPAARLGRLLVALAALDAAGGETLAAAPPAAADPDPRLARVLALVHAGADGPLPAGRAARLAGMHPAAFSRWFARRHGTTWVRYVAAVRVALACRLIADRGQEITAAALAAGFASLSSFNRWFRRLRGEAPRAWRRRLG